VHFILGTQCRFIPFGLSVITPFLLVLVLVLFALLAFFLTKTNSIEPAESMRPKAQQEH